MKNNCLNCEKRYLGCHGSCESYLKFKAERELIRKNRIKQHDKYINH